MIEQLLIALGSALAGYAIDRVKYARQLAKLAATHVPVDSKLGEMTREAAQRAVIEANQKEIERVLRKADEQRAKHLVRIAAIRSGAGEVNVGSLKKED